ncbi:hypothetical protein CHGG_10540 [Chaetomium globosum CBS 148.51]|uniref:Potassium channel tetramerisation-type BTB domain-containing protein n=1 Tax=Chaetomium globosum (strain ATCC 6205 / CBS 148.51 / DSM 1962 / NBRC 6347 / NRRL 1970) TaxID=306901 RepID=Q2GNB4_CHAGB|nr:uncharacterized protein CHGG_10540 [Chaetomium globosum CBS 148.51]EAQ84136.1 hypothetical protein CHGG_10540 [Chaetomium globosum CBS 148.51]
MPSSTVGAEELFLESGVSTHHIPNILPHERVFPVQLGSELFKLSGASISSDAPSYFSQYFRCQVKRAEEAGQDIGSAIRTLYIDRDPITFRDISLHLQGYHVQPRDATHFVRLFADAQFYHLPKLVSQLYEEPIFTTIGGVQFRIPRDLFSAPGNSPNFFTLGFAAFFSAPGGDLFPGLDREGLLRPPSIIPPSVEGRSPETFAELLHLLRGYPVAIRGEQHRAELLRDCRYFNFKGLEQRLIPSAVSFNLARGRDEIVLRLRDILKSGIAVAAEPTATDPRAGWVNYGRPFVDERALELVLEIGDESTRLRIVPGQGAGEGAVEARAEFFGEMRARVTKLLEVVATKLGLPPTAQLGGLLMGKGTGGSAPPSPGNTPLSEDLVKVLLDSESSVMLDGKPWTPVPEEEQLAWTTGSIDAALMPRKRKRVDEQGDAEEWIVKTGQWRLRLQGARNGKAAVECCLVAVKLDAYSSERARNGQRPFLGG